MYSRIAGLVFSGAFVACLAAGPSLALDANGKGRVTATAPLKIFKDPRAAMRDAMRNYDKGNVASALRVLKYLGDKGDSLALWKLGQIYASGEGVKKDDVEAFQYFGRIVRDYKEDQLHPGERSVVASAYVAVGVYSLSGIPRSRVRRNLQRAMHMFHYAATVFRDADAQYNLARMYLDGAGVKRNPRRAVPWLKYAAHKEHVEAAAILGNLLFRGDRGVGRQGARGLMYLTLASDAAQAKQLTAERRRKLAWVVDLYDRAMKAASDSDMQMAHVALKKHLQWRSRR